MSEQILNNMKRRLERWELQHLRNLSSELAERLERVEDEVRHAWDCCEMWQSSALQLQEDLMEEGATIGLTKDGQIGVITDPAPADIRNALLIAESFMRGFEDDPDQEGIAGKLARIRAAIDQAGAAEEV